MPQEFFETPASQRREAGVLLGGDSDFPNSSTSAGLQHRLRRAVLLFRPISAREMAIIFVFLALAFT